MTIDYQKLITWKIPPVEQRYTKRDTMLYALGVGLGTDRCNPDHLKYVYEASLQALPTMAITLGYPGPWHADPTTGINRQKTVHGQQGFTIHRPLPIEGAIVGTTRIRGVIDKGAAKGALVLTECTVQDQASGEIICTTTSTMFCRADGGFGGSPDIDKPLPAAPDRAPDEVCDLPTLPQAALIYRLSGDYNPLHADPAYAKKAGYDTPILHGRCTFSVAGHAILKTCCGYEAARLKSMEGRFSSPVFPGETIRTIWREGGRILFRSSVPARGVTVLANGSAEILP